jgi:tetratricopeptide (TPR) repeat protein
MTEQKFNQLFKRYRLKSEFESLSQFGQAIAEQGRFFDDSTFTHWQNGTRIPKDRGIILTIIKIFILRGGITSFQEANNLLESAGQGYLTETETKTLPSLISPNTPFQVPNEIANFTGRQTILKKFHASSIIGKKILLSGPSGIGKTSLAIHIAHQTKHLFPDGILWYKVDNANPMDILLSIAYTFHENISPIHDLETRASVVRSLLANKKILLILDNVEAQTNLRVLLPNSSTTIIFTSKQKTLSLDSAYEIINLTAFQQAETLELFQKVISHEYTQKNKEAILELADRVGNLPLALQIYAKQLATKQQSPKTILKLIEKNETTLKELTYEDKTLYTSINISFQSLDEKTKKLFLSLGIFEGKDFSLPAVAAINKLSKDATTKQLQKLIDSSLIDPSTNQRYRLHPFIRIYLKPYTTKEIYLLATNYYETFIEKYRRKNTKFFDANKIYPDIENILHVFNFIIEKNFYADALKLWNNLGRFFGQTGEWEKVLFYGEKLYKITKDDKLYQDFNYAKYTLDILARVHYLMGNIQRTKELVLHENKIAKDLNSDFLINVNKLYLGKIAMVLGNFDQSLTLLNEAVEILKNYNDLDETAYAYKFIGEIYIFKNQYTEAFKNFENAYKIVNKTKDMLLLSIIVTTIGVMYYSEGKTIEAEKYLTRAINIEKKYRIRMGMRLVSYLTIALMKKHQKKYSLAKKFFSIAQKEHEYLKIKDNVEKTYAVIHLLKPDLIQAGYYIFE